MRVADSMQCHLDLVSFGVVSILISLTAMIWLPASLLTVLAPIIHRDARGCGMTTWQAGLVGSRAFLNARQTHNLTADVRSPTRWR